MRGGRKVFTPKFLYRYMFHPMIIFEPSASLRLRSTEDLTVQAKNESFLQLLR